jgi:carbon-monoxide dehydrogenase medium subunit
MRSPAFHYGVLKDAVPHIGDVQVRNRGTVGGAIAHADPASDLPACLLALDAEIVARSPRGERTIAATEFFKGAFETALGADEVLTEIRLPAPLDGAGSAYASLEQPASGYALVGVAAVVVRGGPGGPIVFSTVGITGVHEHAYRASEVEAALVGSDGSPEAIQSAAQHATVDVEVSSDIHADAAYRAAMAAVYTRRAIEAALARIG